MKLTKSTLQKIIKEEINNMLNERELPGGMDLDPGSAPRAPAGQQKQQQKLNIQLNLVLTLAEERELIMYL